MPRDNLRDKLEGNELDLSLNDLQLVPVKELANLPKATHLDMSCNLLTTIPEDFCKLVHLVKIDLSKNQLTQLPLNIGRLTKLQHLDLYSNQLKVLPVSMFQLKSLRWLDLKDNPLQEALKKVAGDCLDDQQCKNCAKSIIAFMKNVNSEEERQRQRRLQEEREIEKARKAEEELEREKKKRQRIAERERRRQEYEAAAKEELEKNEQKFTSNLAEESDSEEISNRPQTKEIRTKNRSCIATCCGMLFLLLLTLGIAFGGLYFYCETTHYEEEFCVLSRNVTLKYYKEAEKLFLQYI